MRFLPAKEWLRGYGRPQFGADLLAGVTLAAYLLPAAIGDSSLARVPRLSISRLPSFAVAIMSPALGISISV
jgi:MFS superfamily sulfate permease-like transporter